MIRFLLRLIGYCGHCYEIKQLRGKKLYLACSRCLHAVPALRDEADA